MMSSCHPNPARANGSQDRGDNAWIVNFNNGNSNINNRNNRRRLRLVRGPSREFQGAHAQQLTLRDLHTAWKNARRQKVPSAGQLAFDTNWIDRLLDLRDDLTAGTWSPKPTTCMVATRPKAREIHAPDFSDRVVHHCLVPHLEALYEPRFYAHSYANRKGKGSHAAVRYLQACVRQVQKGRGGGYSLKLDIANCFNRIRRDRLWDMMKPTLERAELPAWVLPACHALLRRSPMDVGVRYACSAAERDLVPLHKRLENAPRRCGLPIGNLSSQFLANVYLDALDQFVKRTLRAPRYLRYVDDFVLVHQDRDQLVEWKGEIERFLATELSLDLKEDSQPQPLTHGVDFLGYVVHPTHTRVRRRVVVHARTALAAWEDAHIIGSTITGTPDDFRAIRAVWASYEGHFRHANSARLTTSLHRRFPWISTATRARRFPLRMEGKPVSFRFCNH